jgi:hypothetical protein
MSTFPFAEHRMNLLKIRQSVGHLKTKIFGFASAEQAYGRQEMYELATAITEYGRMRQEHYGSRSVVLGAGELAMRLRETTQTIVKALGGAKGSGSRSRNRRPRPLETALHRAR